MKKKPIIWSSIILLVLVVIVGGGTLAYFKLKPQNHFNKVPIVNTSEFSSTKPTSTSSIQKPTPPPKFSKDVFNILLLGSDERKGFNVGHTDSIVLVHVDLNKHSYSAVSIPRDTRVNLDGYGYTKLTSVQYIKQATSTPQEGVKAAIHVISNLTGVPINYYVETNYGGLQSMVDTLGTIQVNVPFDVKLTHPWYPEDSGKVVPKGLDTLNGKMTTELVHERYSLARGDYDRQLLQEKVLVGIAKECTKPSNLSKLPQLASQFNSYVVDTNMTKSDMVSLGWALKGFDQNQLHYYQLTGKGESIYDDILKAKNDEMVISQSEIQSVMAKLN